MGYKGKGQIVNRTVLADIFGVALNTIDMWVRAGMPVVARGSQGVAWEFNTANCLKWRQDEAAAKAGDGEKDLDALKIRKLAAETALAELELAKARSDVAPIEQIDLMLSRTFATVRAGMMNIPSRVVSQLIGETDERRFKSVLGDEINIVLENLASTDLSGPAGEDEEDADDEAGEESADE